MKSVIVYFLGLLVATFLANQGFAQTKPIYIWGIPEKICLNYGGSYDVTNGLSEWDVKLVLSEKTELKLAGTFVAGSKELQFVSLAEKSLDGKFSPKTFLFATKDKSYAFVASKTSNGQFEIKITSPTLSNNYSYEPSTKEINDPKLLSGDEKNFLPLIESDLMYMLPLLSYKLGGELGVTGSKFPVSLAIHRLALAFAQNYDIDMRTTKGNYLVPLSATVNSADCTGQMPGSSAQECLGRCGPKCVCWEWACGDCCCHQGCRDHDKICTCSTIRCYLEAILAPFNCAPCNNPGNLPTCSSCPSGQFFCSYTRQCLTNGAQCRPACGPGEVFCQRLNRCVRKTQCENTTPTCSSNANCASDQVCLHGTCYYY